MAGESVQKRRRAVFSLPAIFQHFRLAAADICLAVSWKSFLFWYATVFVPVVIILI